MSAWSSLKLLTQQSESLPLQKGNTEEQEHVTVARALQKFRLKARMSNIPFPIRFPVPKPKTLGQPPSTMTSKILPLIYPKTAPSRRHLTTLSNTLQTCIKTPQKQLLVTDADELPQSSSQSTENPTIPHQHKFPAVGAAPYIPVRHFRAHHEVAPPVTIRNSIPVYSAPPPRMGVAPSNHLSPQFGLPPPMCGGVAPPVTIRQSVPVFSAVTKPVTSSITPNEVKMNTNSHEDSKSPFKPLPTSSSTTEDKRSNAAAISIKPPALDEEAGNLVEHGLKELEI
ncbi:hypothetical protein L1987_75778 [Smallanthus sonchifolius]|uniref:Uncharacterized protein n=1 Tax=Smallanthus sonchifolius TaxID=185202 RepID=A0ACB9A5P0_9ASTR|nr:hypothetical protein L1987_75778 [Smallanthus sonchifolius]